MSLSGAFWRSLDSLTDTLVAVAQRRRNQKTDVSPEPAGRQPDIAEGQRWKEDGVELLYLGSIALTLWRNVELNVIGKAKDLFVHPIMDLGCGDGAFYNLALGHAEIGMDLIDNLDDVVRPGIFDKVVYGDITTNTGLASGSLRTILANSVMEHIAELDNALAEISRLLEPGGRFIATVPMAAFMDGITEWMGKQPSEAFHATLSHFNLLTAEEWKSRLAAAGLELEMVHCYLSPAAGKTVKVWNGSFAYQFDARWNKCVWRFMRGKVSRLIKESLDRPDGYCGMVVARKPGA